ALGANHAMPMIVTANAIIPDRDRLATIETAMTSAATAASSARAPSLDDNASSRLRRSGRADRHSLVSRAAQYPTASGCAISIQPAKLFLLMNGPNGLLTYGSGQKP